MATKIQVRRDNSTDWTTINPTLSEGEIGFETNTGKFKIGDGTTLWSALDYFVDSSELSGYLTASSASTTYLTQASASTNYLTQASASTTYLTQDSASVTYSTKASPTFSGTVNINNTAGTNALTVKGSGISYLQYWKNSSDTIVGSMDGTGSLTADSFSGDGSLLTNVNASSIGEASTKTTVTYLASSAPTTIATIPIVENVVSSECLVLLSSSSNGTYYVSKCLIFGGYPGGEDTANITEYGVMGDMAATLSATRVGSDICLQVASTTPTNVVAKVVSIAITATNSAS